MVKKYPDIDEISGVETTGHQWDDIKELNNPLPKWWLYIMYATIIWGIGYTILYPAWPTLSGYTKGILGYSERLNVLKEIEDLKVALKPKYEEIITKDFSEITADNNLMKFVDAAGKSAFGDNCASCHGSAAQGSKGYPNLRDDDWLWGGTFEQIHTTLKYGIRSGHEETRDNAMPAFGQDEILNKKQIAEVTEYVLSLSNSKHNIEMAKSGKNTFSEQCAACHGDNGTGNVEMGAPNLSDKIWLYGGNRKDIVRTITYSRSGIMPYWDDKLDPALIKLLAIYVHSMGGGK